MKKIVLIIDQHWQRQNRITRVLRQHDVEVLQAFNQPQAENYLNQFQNNFSKLDIIVITNHLVYMNKCDTAWLIQKVRNQYQYKGILIGYTSSKRDGQEMTMAGCDFISESKESALRKLLGELLNIEIPLFEKGWLRDQTNAL